MKERTDTTK